MPNAMADIVLAHRTEGSILDSPRRGDLQAFAVGGRTRLATCSGVAWFRGYHLAVVNLYGGHLRIYRFHPGDGPDGRAPRLELLHEMREGLHCPEEVAVSRDGSVLAIAHSLTDDRGVSLHRIDASTLAPDPAGNHLRRGTAGSPFHGADFSPDGRHLAVTRIGEPAYVEVMRMTPAGERTCLLENRHFPMKPKAVAFTSDGAFIAVVMALNARVDGGGMASAGMVSIHRFDTVDGVVEGEPVAQFKGAGSLLAFGDMCAFFPCTSPNRHRLLVSDQALDAILSFEFDADRHTLSYGGVFAADLSFPHGVEASADGRFVAITTLGDDSLHIARVNPSAGA